MVMSVQGKKGVGGREKPTPGGVSHYKFFNQIIDPFALVGIPFNSYSQSADM